MSARFVPCSADRINRLQASGVALLSLRERVDPYREGEVLLLWSGSVQLAAVVARLLYAGPSGVIAIVYVDPDRGKGGQRRFRGSPDEVGNALDRLGLGVVAQREWATTLVGRVYLFSDPPNPLSTTHFVVGAIPTVSVRRGVWWENYARPFLLTVDKQSGALRVLRAE